MKKKPPPSSLLPAKPNKLLYPFLLLLRLALLFSPGYIHPDEFFQGGQELFAPHPPTHPPSSSSFLPWEWQPEHALRSVLFPLLLVGLPNRILLLLFPSSPIPPSLLLYLPRFLLFGVSVGMDWCVLGLARQGAEEEEEEEEEVGEEIQEEKRKTRSGGKRKKEEIEEERGRRVEEKAWGALLFFASSWPVLLFSTRPFSNTLEMGVLALTLRVFCMGRRGGGGGGGGGGGDRGGGGGGYKGGGGGGGREGGGWKRRVGLGACFSLGLFIRFTYPVYALPIGLAELFSSSSSSSSSPPPSCSKPPTSSWASSSSSSPTSSSTASSTPPPPPPPFYG